MSFVGYQGPAISYWRLIWDFGAESLGRVGEGLTRLIAGGCWSRCTTSKPSSMTAVACLDGAGGGFKSLCPSTVSMDRDLPSCEQGDELSSEA